MPRCTVENFICPNCHTQLQQNSDELFHCPECQIEFSILAGEIPILISQPEHYLAGEHHLVSSEIQQLRQTSAYYHQVAQQTEIRRETLESIALGLEKNAELLESLQRSLPVSSVEIEEHQLALGADLFSSLRKDWSGEPECEEYNQIVFATIEKEVAQLNPQRPLILGAGTGRFLCDFAAKFPNCVGVDLSATMALAFQHLLQHGQLNAFLLMQGNFHRAVEECTAIQAKRNFSTGTPDYIIANASQLPFPDQHFDLIVSNYFTDMLPLSMWLGEASRVLAPQGKLIHFVPLGYTFPQIEEHYSADQLPDAFAEAGFRISEPKFIRTSFFENSRRFNRFQIDNLLFTATPKSATG